MSSHDFSVSSPVPKRYDVCVIGSGPAGFSLAWELARSKKKSVVMLEAGPLSPSDASQAFYAPSKFTTRTDAGPFGGPGKDYLQRSRIRSVGGTSHLWDGWLRELDDYDFEGGGGGEKWPFGKSELGPYYQKALDVLEAEKFKGLQEKSYGNLRDTGLFLSNGARFVKRMGVLPKAKNLDFLYNAPVTSCRMKAGKVLSVSVANQLDIEADRFVLACGGVETTRILLNWQEKYPALTHPQLGLRHNEHVIIPLEDSLFFYDDFLPILDEMRGLGKMPGFSLKESELKEKGLLNFSVYADAESKDPQKGPKLKRSGKLYNGIMMVETRLLEQSTIRVNKDDLCSLGQAKVDMDWVVARQDFAQYSRLLKLLDRQMNIKGIGKLNVNLPEKFDRKILWEAHHFIGSTPMALSPSQGVVDQNLKLHKAENLYAVGSSCFPSAGFCNPTLTIVALSLRLADHLGEL